jgi:RNA polymerase sigma factor (sigma-70 family)
MSWFRMDKFEGRAYQTNPSGEDRSDPDVEIDAEQALNANGAWFRSAADRMERSMRSGGSDGQPEAIDRTISPEDAVMGHEAEKRVRELVEALPAAAAELIKATYYEGLTLKDAAARIGHDKSWASRLHARILQKLATSLKAEGYA